MEKLVLAFSHRDVVYRSTKSSLIRIRNVIGGWAEEIILPICCVCGKEAENLYHGLWWCDKHYPALDKKGREDPNINGIRKAAKR